MARPRKHFDELTQQVSARLEKSFYEDFNRLCHMQCSGMAPIIRQLIIDWIEKNRNKLNLLDNIGKIAK
jgi:hypothetical protein